MTSGAVEPDDQEFAEPTSDGWRLRFQSRPSDSKASREFPGFGFFPILRAFFVQFGTPIAPSILILVAIDMLGLAALILGGFCCLAVYSSWNAERRVLADGVSEVRLGDACIDIFTSGSKLRQAWSLIDGVQSTRSWFYCVSGPSIVAVFPRRIFSDIQAASFLKTVRSAIKSASGAQPQEGSNTVANPETPRVSDNFEFSHPFQFSVAEYSHLLANFDRIVALSVAERMDDSPPLNRRGCLTMMLLQMIAAAAFISQTTGSNTEKIVMWIGACAAIWAPRLVWLGMERFRRTRLLDDADRVLNISRQHGIAAEGFTEVTAEGQQIWDWDHISFVGEDDQFVLFLADQGNLYGTPKRALVDPATTLAQAQRYLEAKRANTFRDAAPTEPLSAPGPAIESGNPYQPPSNG